MALRRGSFALHAELSVPPGLTVLLGPSGAGKSVTLQAIAGLAPLARGRVTLGTRVLADVAAGIALPPGARRLGYVPQASALFSHLSVAENVAYALPRPRRAWWPWGGARAAWRTAQAARVAELLALVRLDGFEGRSPRGLSGGEAQRVALARALAAGPAALLLDEPLSALDAPTRAALRDDLRAVVLASGVPALLVTHDLGEARALADRLVVLIRGRVVAEGPLTEVLASPPTAEAARLLEWRNLLPVARLTAVGDHAEVVLRGGQVLRVPAPGATARVSAQMLAVRADLLTLERGEDAASPGHHSVVSHQADAGMLWGMLRVATDMGAYYAVSVALDGEPRDAPPLALACSPREWVALSLGPGARVRVRVPLGAARVVEATDPAPSGTMGQE
ncbi:MAG: ABC transporter ATP-binding protein [Ktedonobacterales bacterium]|nr:ABC transporter ATP-binding protein [Ktedonobacterales bacterium]